MQSHHEVHEGSEWKPANAGRLTGLTWERRSSDRLGFKIVPQAFPQSRDHYRVAVRFFSSWKLEVLYLFFIPSAFGYNPDWIKFF